MNDIILTKSGLSLQDKNAIVTLFRAKNELKIAEENIKANLLSEMKKRGIKQIKIEEEGIVIDYIYPTTKESLDSKKLSTEKPDIYDEYCKISDVKEHIKISEVKK